MLQHPPPQGESPLQLIVPDLAHLDGYADALRRGWSPDNVRIDEPPRQELARIEANPATFVASLDDPDAKAGPVTLPDGSVVPRIPGVVRWMWDGEFCGAINARWQPGTPDLPPHVLGHIGYSVVPWKQRLGYATDALGRMLGIVRDTGLPWVEITTQPDNIASQKVILANGGVALGEFVEPEQYGGRLGLKYRIDLA